MNVKIADAAPSLDRTLNVLGREQNQQIRAAITANTTVHWLWLVMVLRYLALTKTCSPYVLLVALLDCIDS